MRKALPIVAPLLVAVMFGVLLCWNIAHAPEPAVAIGSPEHIAAFMAEAAAEKRIVDAHVHIQSTEEMPKLLAAMDRLGIGQTHLMGSSWFTITLNQKVGFTRYDWNNEQLLEIGRAHPGRFEAWVTINPDDSEKLPKLKQAIANGALGLKLYTGHGFIIRDTNEYMFHTMALDDPRMLPVYEYCDANFVPVCLHVNPGPTKPGFAEEFIAVLRAWPDMKVVCPHYMLSSIKDSRLREFLLTFPNLYSDISFGHDDFLVPGLKRISRDPGKFRRIFSEFPDRFFFSTDLVVTEANWKTDEWIYDRMKAYLDMLTKEQYTSPVIPGEELNGLALPVPLLEGILYRNFVDFLAKKPQDTEVTRDIDWSKMGHDKTSREPGQAFPPPRKN